MRQFKSTRDLLFDEMSELNPMVTKCDYQNKEIAMLLLDQGYTIEQIQHFVSVSRTQLDQFLESEVKGTA